ncbi:hypothetical protein [Amycolatopsis sp. lyj-112]|uniref:hypothetical protein n=1 Tax=Amycolatopsis sp. lyj-112 TaxID=2789288 RepID=UPI00397CA202
MFYEELIDSHSFPFVLCSAEGAPLRRSNCRNRYWRPVWDGSEAEHSRSAVVVQPYDHVTLLMPSGRTKLGEVVPAPARHLP